MGTSVSLPPHIEAEYAHRTIKKRAKAYRNQYPLADNLRLGTQLKAQHKMYVKRGAQNSREMKPEGSHFSISSMRREIKNNLQAQQTKVVEQGQLSLNSIKMKGQESRHFVSEQLSRKNFQIKSIAWDNLSNEGIKVLKEASLEHKASHSLKESQAGELQLEDIKPQSIQGIPEEDSKKLSIPNSFTFPNIKQPLQKENNANFENNNPKQCQKYRARRRLKQLYHEQQIVPEKIKVHLNLKAQEVD